MTVAVLPRLTKEGGGLWSETEFLIPRIRPPPPLCQKRRRRAAAGVKCLWPPPPPRQVASRKCAREGKCENIGEGVTHQTVTKKRKKYFRLVQPIHRPRCFASPFVRPGSISVIFAANRWCKICQSRFNCKEKNNHVKEPLNFACLFYLMKHNNNRQFPSHSDLVIERREVQRPCHRIGRPPSLKMARSLLVAFFPIFFSPSVKKFSDRASGEERSALPENSPAHTLRSPKRIEMGKKKIISSFLQSFFLTENSAERKKCHFLPLKRKMDDLCGFVCLWKAVNKGR